MNIFPVYPACLHLFLIIMVFDSYNNDWFEKELSIKKIKKIVFEGSVEKPVRNYQGEPVFSSTAENIKEILDDAPKIIQKPVEKKVYLKVQFDFNSYKIRKKSYPVLKELGNALRDLKAYNKTLYIYGHTDSVGKNRYNLNLSKKRAGAVKTWLLKEYGLKSYKIKINGYGEKKPLVKNNSEKNRQTNRRVEIKLGDS